MKQKILKILGKTTAIFGITLAIIVLYFAFFPVFSTPYMDSEKRRLGSLKHEWVSISALKPLAAASVIAAEDSGFCAHNGVEWGVTFDLVKDGGNRGGSTISQQMVKNVFLWQGQSRVSKITRKAVEIPLTMIIEMVYSKRRIAEIYLNSIEYDTGVFGIEAAALHHFNVHAEDLSAHQMALLAAVLPNPKVYQAAPAGAYVKKRAGKLSAGQMTLWQGNWGIAWSDTAITSHAHWAF